MSIPQPKPLLDTIVYLMEEPSNPLQRYLKQLDYLPAQKDYLMAKKFLLSYVGSVDTFNSYRREVERLLQWSWLIEKKSIMALTREEITQYVNFVKKPPETWIAYKNVARFISKGGERDFNPEWRPFVQRNPKAKHYALSNKSLHVLFATLNTFYTFLQQENKIDKHPIALMRQKSRFLQRQQHHRVTRKLSELQWETVMEATNQLADSLPGRYERSRFMMACFYLLGLRISELAETPERIPKMSDFSPDKEGRWWFTTVGKGNKLRDVAVPDALLGCLKAYRLTQALSPLPHRGETTPLLHKERGSGGLGTRQIRNLVQQCFDGAVTLLLQRQQTDAAEDLRAATVHWLRHTAISLDIISRPREHVRDDAGHGHMNTTVQYIEINREERHESAKHKGLLPKIAVPER